MLECPCTVSRSMWSKCLVFNILNRCEWKGRVPVQALSDLFEDLLFDGSGVGSLVRRELQARFCEGSGSTSIGGFFMRALPLLDLEDEPLCPPLRDDWEKASAASETNLSIGGAQPSYKPQSPARDVKPFSMSSTRPVDPGGKGNLLIESIPDDAPLTITRPTYSPNATMLFRGMAFNPISMYAPPRPEDGLNPIPSSIPLSGKRTKRRARRKERANPIKNSCVPLRRYKIKKNALDGCPGIEKEGRFQRRKAIGRYRKLSSLSLLSSKESAVNCNCEKIGRSGQRRAQVIHRSDETLKAAFSSVSSGTFCQSGKADDSQELLSTESFGTSMSTHHILGLKKVPRVRLFADLSGTAGQLSWYGRTAAPREILLYTSSRTRFLNRTSIGERCKHRENCRVLLINRTRREVKIRNSKKIATNWIKPIVDWVVKGLCGGDAKEHSGTSEGNNRSSNGPAAQPKKEIAEGKSSDSTKKKDGEKKEDPSSLLGSKKPLLPLNLVQIRSIVH
ncbi:hypothetical protein ACH5RR_023665 [Cinchona calisaya]|uniref:Uncharacterized protein n=1 Tax=Cinchona calisaya TaxID=153742 RepID=A0ABD2ZBC9_9GENT